VACRNRRTEQTFVADANGRCVLEVEWSTTEDDLADWNLIVKCVNLHDELVQALERADHYFVRDMVDQGDRGAMLMHTFIEALLAKAKGEA
jgi:hypothetical protein